MLEPCSFSPSENRHERTPGKILPKWESHKKLNNRVRRWVTLKTQHKQVTQRPLGDCRNLHITHETELNMHIPKLTIPTIVALLACQGCGGSGSQNEIHPGLSSGGHTTSQGLNENEFEPGGGDDSPGGGFGGAGGIYDPDFRAPGPFRVKARGKTSLTLTWLDQTPLEDYYMIQRKVGSSWQNLQNIPAHSGWGEFEHTGLASDTQYCYRMVAYDGSVSKNSQFFCAYTRGPWARPLAGLHIEIETGTVNAAGTNNPVQILLNAAWGQYLPFGSSNWLDYPRNDFESGDVFTYAIGNAPKDLADITRLTLHKEGTDG